MPIISRRTFALLLVAAGIGAAIPLARSATTGCTACGRPIVRGSRAVALAAVAHAPEDDLCLFCLASRERFG
jgi:hypothetical protein